MSLFAGKKMNRLRGKTCRLISGKLEISNEMQVEKGKILARRNVVVCLFLK
jgi:hypothetical protein